jgi:hypothetical protein
MTKTEKKFSSRIEAQRSKSRWWTLRSIFVVAAVFNYAWELVQAPLYEGMEHLRTVWWHCFVASLGDGLLVLPGQPCIGGIGLYAQACAGME